MTSAAPRYKFSVNNFDLIRLLAAFQVLLVHGIGHLDVSALRPVVKALEIFPGVPIFFVTSGYLISASWERTPSLSAYVRNRFLRIYPALWTCLLVTIATLVIFYEVSIVRRETVPWLAAQVSIGQFYNPGFLRDYGVGAPNGSLWTIPVELQFYLVLPLLYPLLRWLFARPAMTVVTFAALIAINVAHAQVHTSEATAVKLFGVTVLPYLCMFLVGVYLQRHQEIVERWMVGKALHWLAAVVAAAVAAEALGFQAAGNYLTPVSFLLLGGFTLAAAYTRPHLARTLLRGNDLSYGLYIYHMVIINVLVHTGAWESPAALPVVIGGTATAAWLSWRLVERPALALKRRA